MGGTLSNLWSWIFPPQLNTTPDPATGLSERDRFLIRASWELVGHKKVIKENGVEFFIQLFDAYPYMKDYFPTFQDMNREQIRKSRAMRTHALPVMYAIGNYVENLEDPEALVGLVEKIGSRHLVDLKIKPKDFENLAKMFVPYLKTLVGDQCTTEIGEAWTKLLAAQTAIVTAQAEKL